MLPQRDVVENPSVSHTGRWRGSHGKGRNSGYVTTQPGPAGVWAAFLGEIVITFLLMSVVLRVSNTPKLSRYTGLFAGTLVATYITLEGPISGMSMNPARTFASALAAWDWTALWVYFTAPLLGMLLAAQVYLWQRGSVFCAKLHHDNGAGLGANHQTGWTGLVAKLLQQSGE
ncbi:MAG TPA: aquaporin [Chthonomonadaceae bacterium]|nr:aquaporin [Chthonomonadaceae bacterium]